MVGFKYSIKRTKKLSGLSVMVHPEKGVMVRAPFWVPELAISHFIQKKSGWITKHLQRFESTKVAKKTYTQGEKHLYLGCEYSLVYSYYSSPQRTNALIVGEDLVVKIYEGHVGEKKKTESKDALLRMYLEKGMELMTERANYYCSELDVDYSQIIIKKVSSIWGSCSPSNKLCFNRKLIMAPIEIVNYVVIHEVCHLVHRNHSSRFWGLVARFDPDYKKHRRWLHHNHAILDI